MSSNNKFKINKNKKLKSTIIGLTLSLIIGFTGAVGTYSYFSDQLGIKNDLKITLGNLKTSIDKDINIEKLESNSEISKTFYIENEGSLGQNIKIRFSNLEQNIDYKEYTNSDKIKYTLKITKNNQQVITISKSIKELENTVQDIGVLQKGESYKCELTLNTGNLFVYEDSYVKFKLQVEANQLGGAK